MSLTFFSLSPTLIQVLAAGQTNPKKTNRIIYGQAISNTSGVATFYFTDNGLANGNSLLTTIDFAVASVYSNTMPISGRARVQMREKSLGGKYVSANVTNFSGVELLGVSVLTTENPMNGVTVDFMVLGSF